MNFHVLRVLTLSIQFFFLACKCIYQFIFQSMSAYKMEGQSNEEAVAELRLIQEEAKEANEENAKAIKARGGLKIGTFIPVHV